MNSPPHPSNHQPGSDLPTLQLGQIWQSVIERPWLFGSIIVLITLITALVNFKLPNIYRATTVLQINVQAPKVLNVQEVIDQTGPTQTEFLKTQFKVLESRTLANRVYEKLQLEKVEEFAPKPPSALNIALNWLSTLITNKPLKEEELAEGEEYTQGPDRSKIYYEHVDIQPERLTLLVRIHANSENRKLAARIANTHADEYNRFVLEQRYGTTREATTYLEKEAVDLLERVQKSEAALQAYREENSITTSFDTEEKVIEELRAQLAKAKAEAAKLEERYLEKHPKLIEAKGSVQELETSAREKESNLIAMRKKHIQYENLKRQADTDKKIYENVLSRMKEMKATDQLEATSVQVVDRAVAPDAKFKPKRFRNIILALFGSTGLALALCVGLHLGCQTIRGPEDLPGTVDADLLGYIPSIDPNVLTDFGALRALGEQRAAAEAFRTAEAILSLKPKAAGAAVFLITSAAPGEGKTLCSTQLAATFAESGMRTLLIDTDFRRPGLSRNLGLKDDIGLHDLLDKGHTLDALIQKTLLPKLDVLVTKEAGRLAHTLLASPAFAKLLDEARGRYDRIIMDTAPVGAVADAITLSKLADGVLWIARFNNVRKRVIREAYSRFTVSTTPVIGVIINDIDFSRRSSYYYYSYRGYSKYYHSTGRSSRPASEPNPNPTPPPQSAIPNPQSEFSANGAPKVTIVKPHSRKSSDV